MLAGLPKAPSAYNPVVNPKRARTRQQYILIRMHSLGYITDAQFEAAKIEPLKIKTDSGEFGVHAEYVAEMARQLVYEQFKEETYTRGLNVFTTVTKADQDAAYLALRRGVMDYEKRHSYRGPEAYIDIPAAKEEADEAIETELAEHPDSDDIIAAMVLHATPAGITAVTASGEEIKISGAGLGFAKEWLTEKAAPNRRVKRGAVIRVTQEGGSTWSVTQMPEIESAFVAADTTDGAIRALVGGFDYNRNKFNHVTQAWRQPGSSFKPFIYSASLERGLSPATIINDAPISFDAGQTGGQAWEPKNYDGKYDGPMTMRKGLTKSKNMISIRILNKIGAKYGQEYTTRFGFDADKNPPYLTLALGAGSTTPLQMAGAYAVFANGGYRVSPYLISKVTDADGKVLSQANPDKAGVDANRVIDERNAFLVDSMLKDVVRFGTATKALVLKRPDISGKTGTTNDSIDAWFAGYAAQAGGDCLDRLRPAEKPRQQGNRRRAGAADLDRLHAEGAEERAGGRARGAVRAGAGRRRVLLRREPAGHRGAEPRRRHARHAGRRKAEGRGQERAVLARALDADRQGEFDDLLAGLALRQRHRLHFGQLGAAPATARRRPGCAAVRPPVPATAHSRSA